jgi:5-methyltetrahydropteroyltriglutamate--homocysteine methyltransferase
MWTTVVGNYPKIPNLPREAKLRKAIRSHLKGKISEEDLRRVEDEVTLEVIQEQAEAGIDILTDGQIRWDDAQTAVMEKMQGITMSGLTRYFDTNTYYRQPIVEGAVAWKEPIFVRDLEFAMKHSPKPVKAVLTGPVTLARLSADRHYGETRRLVLDLARALSEEARRLEQAGAALVQFDEPSIVRQKDDIGLLQEAAPILRDGLKGKTALYTYFGDARGILPGLLECGFDILGLDFCTSDGNWEILREIQGGLAAGIVDARNTRRETEEEIAGRIRRLLDHVPTDRLYINPSAGLEFLPREAAQEKLKALVEGARKAKR